MMADEKVGKKATHSKRAANLVQWLENVFTAAGGGCRKGHELNEKKGSVGRKASLGSIGRGGGESKKMEANVIGSKACIRRRAEDRISCVFEFQTVVGGRHLALEGRATCGKLGLLKHRPRTSALSTLEEPRRLEHGLSCAKSLEDFGLEARVRGSSRHDHGRPTLSSCNSSIAVRNVHDLPVLLQPEQNRRASLRARAQRWKTYSGLLLDKSEERVQEERNYRKGKTTNMGGAKVGRPKGELEGRAEGEKEEQGKEGTKSLQIRGDCLDSLRGLPVYRVVKPPKSIYIAQLNVPMAFTKVGLGTSWDFHPIRGATLTCNAASYLPREALEAAQVVGWSSLRMQCAFACETIWCFWFMPQSGVGYEI
ncbi:hypothetical protein Acr_28g0005530 [Actinidia rufa]|uniref:Uncharacterized protein n=1 Tax=Actinidia rufa TaxID=165716 RepID=A0A7J0HA05_9ERIC|nr:hypothetical protein Acr_28g0005530 [Actinidia rufa]